VEQIFTCNPWTIPHQSRWMPEGGCDLEKFMLEQAPRRICGPMERGAHTGAGYLAGLLTP